MILKKWDKSIDLKKEVLGSIPIWIKLFDVPMHCRGTSSISKICSLFAKPIHMDDISLTRERGAFVCVTVEVDVHEELPTELDFKVHGTLCRIRVEYTWKPQICTLCHAIDHGVKACPMKKVDKKPSKPTQVWRIKKNGKEVVIDESTQSPQEIVPMVGESSVIETDATRVVDLDSMVVVIHVQEDHHVYDQLPKPTNSHEAVEDTATMDDMELTAAKKKNNKKKINGQLNQRTRVKIDKFDLITNKINGRWKWINNYSYHHLGRIWAGWDPSKVDIIRINTNEQAMLLKVQSLELQALFWMSPVYAANSEAERKQLWSTLRQYATITDEAWLTMGD
ncbi:uncharacterized protein LOC132314156 [Cornus florida]|uniref:uncharacterized protein LOC132314156 n=1 Tax=Cornus florida TaxID=4283 RepID=UPI002897FC09|nr:uncharacterized protein LOC132314156 [Cornus florida]